jgi:hypothetical protein
MKFLFFTVIPRLVVALIMFIIVFVPFLVGLLMTAIVGGYQLGYRTWNRLADWISNVQPRRGGYR